MLSPFDRFFDNTTMSVKNMSIYFAMRRQNESEHKILIQGKHSARRRKKSEENHAHAMNWRIFFSQTAGSFDCSKHHFQSKVKYACTSFANNKNLLKKLNESCGFVYSTKHSDGKFINEKMLTDLFPYHAEIAFTKQTR